MALEHLGIQAVVEELLVTSVEAAVLLAIQGAVVAAVAFQAIEVEVASQGSLVEGAVAVVLLVIQAAAVVAGERRAIEVVVEHRASSGAVVAHQAIEAVVVRQASLRGAVVAGGVPRAIEAVEEEVVAFLEASLGVVVAEGLEHHC